MNTRPLTMILMVTLDMVSALSAAVMVMSERGGNDGGGACGS